LCTELAALIANRDLGLESIDCSEAPGATGPPCLPSTPTRRAGSPRRPCVICASLVRMSLVPLKSSFTQMWGIKPLFSTGKVLGKAFQLARYSC